MVVSIAPERLWRVLLAIIAVVSAVGLAAELVQHLVWPDMPLALRGLLSLSYEANVPTWVSSCLLFSCGLALAAVAMRVSVLGAAQLGRWRLLAVFFFYMSLDELAGFHEHLGEIVHLYGILYFSWVVPAAAVVAVMGVLYIPFVRGLPALLRRRVIIAGCIYVTGALVMELPLGYWTERAGDENLGYALIDWVEETLEMLGAGLFLVALWSHLGEVEER